MSEAAAVYNALAFGLFLGGVCGMAFGVALEQVLEARRRWKRWGR